MHAEHEIRMVSGRELPQQFHLGPRCRLDWLMVKDDRPEGPTLSVKPRGVLWTSAARQAEVSGRISTAWSETYFGRGYDAKRRASKPILTRMRETFTPERLWPVQLDSEQGSVARLGSEADLVEAARRWPDGQGRISFEAMAADGIDGVWATSEVLPGAWVSSEWQDPNAAVRAQFYGWEVESVAWLRADHLTVGKSVPVSEYPRGQSAPSDHSLDAARSVTGARSPYRASFPKPATEATRPGTSESAAKRPPQRPGQRYDVGRG